MLKQRRVWAQEAGLDADVIESMYRNLVNYFIEEEMKRWQAEKSGSDPAPDATA